KKMFIGDTLTAGTTAVTSHLLVSNTAGSVVQIKNTNTGGSSSILFTDNSGTAKGTIGYSNSGASLTIAGGALLVDSTVTTTTFGNTTDSTTPGTGSVLFLGGIGVSKTVSIGGDLGMTGTIISSKVTASTNPTSGAILLIGGIGIN